MSGSTIELSSYLIDQIRCPTCGMVCLQKNIYRHVTQIHNWGPEECKNLVGMIRNEKKSRESKASFACAYCRALFKSCRHLMAHKKICAHNPHIDPNGHGEMEDMFIDDLIVEGDSSSEMHHHHHLQYDTEPTGVTIQEVEEEEIIVEGTDEQLKASTSSAPSENHQNHVYELIGPPHRHLARPIPNHHLSSPHQKPSILSRPRLPLSSQEDRPLILPPSSSGGGNKNQNFARHRGTHLKCPECPASAECLEEFINHCHEKHFAPDRQFIVERRQFKSVANFKKWFDQRQEDTCTSLTKRTGHGGETLYRCHRVGKYRSVAKSRKSNPRKVDQTCTAYLKVTTEENGNTWATGCFTHIGHDLDHRLLWLTESQENYIRELIDLGWNSDQIFFYVRSEYKDYDCKLKYVTKNDIRNITVRYNRLKESQGELIPGSSSKSFPKNQEEEEGGPEENLAENLASIGNEDVLVPEDDEEDVKAAKIPRLEDPRDPQDPPKEEELTSEIVDVADMIVVEEALVLNPEVLGEPSEAMGPPTVALTPSTVTQVPPEDVGPATVPPTVEDDDDDEYINVVDDDSMPELEKVDG